MQLYTVLANSKTLSQFPYWIISSHLFLHIRSKTWSCPPGHSNSYSWHNNSHIAAIFCFFFCLLAYDAALSHLLTLQVCAHLSHIRHQISDRASCSISLSSSSTDFLIPASDGPHLNSWQTHCYVARRGHFPSKAAQLLVLWGIVFVACCMGAGLLVQKQTGSRGWG